jgi:hypothetical protein
MIAVTQITPPSSPPDSESEVITRERRRAAETVASRPHLKAKLAVVAQLKPNWAEFDRPDK